MISTPPHDDPIPLFDAQDELDRQRAELIARIEGKLAQRIATVPLFMIRWSVGGQ
jgi:adenine-specific DNA-methyltransferase